MSVQEPTLAAITLGRRPTRRVKCEHRQTRNTNSAFAAFPAGLQEALIGEGVFFGLGCSLKFPVNLLQAPYSLIAAGVLLPPQRIAFPFSLVSLPRRAQARLLESPPIDNTGVHELFPG
jgi:hypothetical protein